MYLRKYVHFGLDLCIVHKESPQYCLLTSL